MSKNIDILMVNLRSVKDCAKELAKIYDKSVSAREAMDLIESTMSVLSNNINAYSGIVLKEAEAARSAANE